MDSIDQLAEVFLVSIESVITEFANSQMTKCAGPSIFCIRLLASLAGKWVVSVGAPIHRLVSVETVVMRSLQGHSFQDGVLWNGLGCLLREIKCLRIRLLQDLHLGVEGSISTSVHGPLRLALD